MSEGDPQLEGKESKIGAAIEAFGKSYITAKEQQEAQHREVVIWQKIGAGVLGVYTLLTLCLVVLSKCTLDSNNAGNVSIVRAWIQPQNSPSPSTSIATGSSPPIFTVTYTNSGHEPALGLVERGRLHVIPIPKDDKTDVLDLPVWKEIEEIKETSICSGLSSKLGGEVIYDQGFGQFSTEKDDSIQMENVRARIAILIIYGCIVYKTPAIPQDDRTTSFCWFYKPEADRPVEQWQPVRCPQGNYAT